MFQIVSCNKVTRALWRPLSLLKNGGDKKGRSIDCNKIYLRIWGNIDLLYDWRVYGNFKLPAVVIEACFGLWGDERKGTCRLSGNEFQERFLNCLWFITAEGPLNEEHFGQVQLFLVSPYDHGFRVFRGVQCVFWTPSSLLWLVVVMLRSPWRRGNGRLWCR